MKKIIFLSALTAIFGTLAAQTVEEGSQFLYYERYQSAEDTYHKVLQQDANKGSAWYGLVTAYILQNEVDKANDTIRVAPATVQSDPFYKIAYGSALLAQEKKEQAAIYFNQALEQTREKDAAVLAAIARAHINAKNGDANYAVSLLEKAIKRDKKNPELYVLTGDAFRKLNNGTEAFKAYKEALDKDDKYAAAYHKTGEIFLTQKNSEIYLENFNKAIGADPNYAPSLYQLYVHEFYHDAARAMNYYKDYLSKSDASIRNQYDMADLLYLNKQYDQAVSSANKLLQSESDKVQPRLYKLISYSYAAKGDTAQALSYMEQYFAKEADSNFIIKDYEAMSDYYASTPGKDSLAMVYLEKGIALEKDTATRYAYYKKLADMAQERKDYASQAKWLGHYYTGNDKASNLDLFYWGIAHYRTEDYAMADSIFGMYISKYPEQGFGYYWQAKSKALQDKEMAQGLAIPVYEKLIGVLQNDTTDENYKKWIVEAYNYLAAYEVNTKKNFAQAINYFEKVLEVDPGNDDAQKYIAMLEKNMATKNAK